MNEAKWQLSALCYAEEPPDSIKIDVDVNPPCENMALGTETTRPIFRDNDAMNKVVTSLEIIC